MMDFKNLICYLLLLANYSLFAQNSNINLVYHEDIEEDCNDIWGFVDKNGNEYAVIGTRSETRIYSLKDTSDIHLIYSARGARSVWRDIKYWNNHLYITHDQDTFGLTIIDVTNAPDTFSHTQWKPTLNIGGSNARFLRAHNLFIDNKGFAYISGHNISKRGVMILDLNQDPNNPVYMSATNEFYSHDAFVRNDTLFSSELSSGFGIYDVTDKSNPLEIGRGRSGRNFTHNAWASPDGKTLFTTDEVASGFLESYDISDVSNIKFLDRYKTNPGNTRVIPHNTHILGDFAITSWYTDGVIINDVSDPANIIKVGSYDTYTTALPASGSLFLGDWGAYPYLPSGLLLVSDINNGLFVFQPSYVKGAYLSGTTLVNTNGVIDTLKGSMIKVLDTDIERFGNDGSYKIGLTPNVDYKIVFSHPEFGSDTVSIALESGSTAELNYTFTRISTGIEDQITDEILLYPNPAQHELIVSSLENKKFSFDLFDRTGQKITSGRLLDNGSLDVRALTPGSYYLVLRVDGEKYQIVKTFIKQ